MPYKVCWPTWTPHSIFIPAVDLSEVNEDLQGNFEGIGIEFQIFDDTVNVMNVLTGGPSDKSGLLVGDKLLKVGDSVVAGNHITTDRIRKLLRGPGASKVAITFYVEKKAKMSSLPGGTIPLPAVDVAYMIDKTTGYIRINKFSETTHAELHGLLCSCSNRGFRSLSWTFGITGAAFCRSR